jgi:phosphate:Na+ symporter
MFHTLFNVSTALILIFFVKQLSAFTYKVIPKIPEEDMITKSFVYLESDVRKEPDLAIEQATQEVSRIATLAYENLSLAVESFYDGDTSKANQVMEQEEIIDFLYQDMKTWLIEARSLELSDKNIEKTAMMLRAISDIERIGDYGESLAENVLLKKENATLSKEALSDLKELSQKTLVLIRAALEVYKNDDEPSLQLIEIKEQEIIDIFEKNIENHIVRCKNGEIDHRGGILFTDMAYYMKRCASHATNIAFSILSESEWCKYRKTSRFKSQTINVN